MNAATSAIPGVLLDLQIILSKTKGLQSLVLALDLV